jgi:2,3-bisphosphoglycerate-dependent phosphoglycerate mutase
VTMTHHGSLGTVFRLTVLSSVVIGRYAVDAFLLNSNPHGSRCASSSVESRKLRPTIWPSFTIPKAPPRRFVGGGSDVLSSKEGGERDVDGGDDEETGATDLSVVFPVDAEDDDDDETTLDNLDYFLNSDGGFNGRNANINGYSMTSGYSAFLDEHKLPAPKWVTGLLRSKGAGGAASGNTQKDNDMNEDGYADLERQRTPPWRRAVALPLRTMRKALFKDKRGPGTLILLRHGESEWNAVKGGIFTGWADVDLSEQGKVEIEYAARLLIAGGYKIDVVFTSRLKRAIRSTWILLQECNKVYLPVFKSWRLNERFYGALQGLSKTQTAERLGEDLVQEWRGSLRTRPPSLTETDMHYPGRDRKYADLTKEQIPLTESLLDCMERTYPLWNDKIKYELKRGRNVLVVAHANTLRGLVKTIDSIGDAEIQEVGIPTGIPIVYKFDEELKPIPPSREERAISQVHMTGRFLEKPGTLKEALKREDEWARNVPGYDRTMQAHKRPMTAMERSLFKLNAVREMGEWAREFIDLDAEGEDDGSDGNFGRPISISEDEIWANGINELQSGEQIHPDGPKFHPSAVSSLPNLSDDRFGAVMSSGEEGGTEQVLPSVFAQPCVTSIPTFDGGDIGAQAPKRLDSVIVIIRHGKTQHNKLGLFTGWEDVPLADEGIEEAKEAGRLLKVHGFEFDVVYTSWLSRAVETAWYVLDELDSLWLPIVKTWRLNERMYGSLTGLSKQMVKQQHGEKQFKAWRRGFDVRPPGKNAFADRNHF